MAFSKLVLKKVPQFDTDLGAGALGFVDDSLFSLQIKEAGYRIGSALDIEVVHHFQQDRLLRTGFLQTAKKFGQSAAYTSYHWHHLDTSNLLVRLIIQWTRLLVWRASHRKAVRQQEGISVRELDLLSSLHSCHYMLRERGTPRHYEKHGLLKLRK